MADIAPHFTAETAHKKVKAAQALWNSRDPLACSKAYTVDSVWRNRDQFFQGHEAIIKFLTEKWEREQNYRLRKELFAYTDNKIAVQFWYEYELSEGDWRRCYGLEDWTFDVDGKMKKRQMSGNEIQIQESERWFKDGMSVEECDSLVLGDAHH